jgi:chemotaxis signal transduction protein
VEYLPFRIAGRDFVIDASRVRAIVPFEGHPRDIPVFDLRERLGLPPVFYGQRPFLVVVETNVSESGLAGFAADYVSDLIKGSPEQRRGGKLRGRGRPRWVLDPDSLRIDRPNILRSARKTEPGSRSGAELLGS